MEAVDGQIIYFSSAERSNLACNLMALNLASFTPPLSRL